MTGQLSIYLNNILSSGAHGGVFTSPAAKKVKSEISRKYFFLTHVLQVMGIFKRKPQRGIHCSHFYSL